jgi:hypothetical protein
MTKKAGQRLSYHSSAGMCAVSSRPAAYCAKPLCSIQAAGMVAWITVHQGATLRLLRGTICSAQALRLQKPDTPWMSPCPALSLGSASAPVHRHGVLKQVLKLVC